MKTLSFFLIMLFTFSSCTESNNKKINKEIYVKNVFTKKWKSVEKVLPYNSTLWIKKDSTFQFNFKVCLGKGYSNGIWKIDSPYIVLNSYEIDSCLYLSEFGKNCFPVSDSMEFINKTTIKDCIPISEIKYVKFANDSFYIKQDTLFHVPEQNNFCSDSMDIFTENAK